MSTYTHRYYEVKTSVIDQYIDWNKKDEPIVADKPLYDGYTIKLYYDNEMPYRIWSVKDNEWKKSKTCRKKWVLAKWFTNPAYGYSPNRYDVEIGKINPVPNDKHEYYREPLAEKGDKLIENICYCDNGGIIRDDFISSRGWNNNDSGFPDRGFPDDMSEELKKEFSKDMDYTWGHTYVLLSEWDTQLKKKIAEFRKKVIEKTQSIEFDKINEKLDLLFKKVKDPYYEPPKKKKDEEEEEGVEYYEDTMDYIWEEDFWDMMSIHSEIMRAYCFTEEFGWSPEEDIRIVYYLS